MSVYELRTRESSDGSRVEVELWGELDLTNARELELRLDETVPAEVRLVLDLNHVTFIDSAALHVLFKVARRRGPEGLAIALEPNAQIARALAIAGLDHVAPVGPAAGFADASAETA